MDTKIIRDVGAYWLGEHNSVILYAEMLDGSEVELAEIEPKEKPSFATNENADDSDYGEWYDEALKLAHKEGYVLEAEAD